MQISFFYFPFPLVFALASPPNQPSWSEGMRFSSRSVAAPNPAPFSWLNGCKCHPRTSSTCRRESWSCCQFSFISIRSRMKGDSRSAIRIHAQQRNIMTECMTVSGRKKKAINPWHTLQEMRDGKSMFLFLPSSGRAASYKSLSVAKVLRSHAVWYWLIGNV